ncbi:MAG: hypothetical protein Q8L51_00110 [Candidatus Amesbacteria bacterium]|nr:hypothetical protein [Candidatus Amesbacteria bacterium]
MNKLTKTDILLEVDDVFDKKVRITAAYWKYVLYTKHREAINELNIELLKKCLVDPNFVISTLEKSVVQFYHQMDDSRYVCVVVRHLNGDGFVITSYITRQPKRNNKILWSRK